VNQAEKELAQFYKNVFGTQEGRIVLGHILLHWCHFTLPLETEQERIEYNIGLSIAQMSGIMSDIEALSGIKGVSNASQRA
jgi:hypothetical protein